jgi:ankyrin repeat protein
MVSLLLFIITEPTLHCAENEELVAAAGAGEFDTVKTLLQQGVSPNSRSEYQDTSALTAAVRGSHTVIVRLLIQTGADVNYQNEFNRSTALMFVKNPRIAALLIHAGAEVNVFDNWGMSPLNWAATDAGIEVTQVLLEAGAGTTPEINRLMLAASRGSTDELRRLLEQGTDINTPDRVGWTPLSVAAEIGHADMARLLLEAGANPNIRYTGWIPLAPPHGEFTPLMGAAKHGHTEITKLLLEQGAQVNARDFYRTTALFHAVRGDSADSVRLLIKAGALLEDPHWGTKPLTEAVRLGHTECMRVLLEAGADPAEALDFARKQNKTEIIELIEKLVK